MIRSIFADSSMVIAGSVSRKGASRAVLTLAEIGLFRLIVSRQVIDECQRNLQKKFPSALPDFANLLSSTNLTVVENPTPTESDQWLPYIEPKDAPILGAAFLASVDRLITLNTKDFTPQVAQVTGLRIQLPSEFVQEIRDIITKGLV